ncbi:hypothetical protein AMTR_s00064p00044070 [Amborella trichopoda]|uniref:Uncharacterized protein n=1 Tax=Amborella trichopoda TaxID=13333 RepID=U5DC02_AMBTC|nr:hypothetical protein AMTR_s00064p00044070 [Amborella trichopoda]
MRIKVGFILFWSFLFCFLGAPLELESLEHLSKTSMRFKAIFHFSKRCQPHRVLVEAKLDSKKLRSLLIEDEPEEIPVPDKPYSLGPKISDWGSQRAQWLEQTLLFQISLDPRNLGFYLLQGLPLKLARIQ